MTRIDFYILPEGAPTGGGPVMTACKLCDKAVAAGHRIYVNAPDPALAEDLDGALWMFRQGGFISHERFHGTAPDAPLPAVLIGTAEPPDSHHGVMLNLGLEVPDYFSRFERVLEIVAADPQGRVRWSSRLPRRASRPACWRCGSSGATRSCPARWATRPRAGSRRWAPA
ncbi:MAG: DNA polymerase III subunit chi [Solimonas sp.]